MRVAKSSKPKTTGPAPRKQQQPNPAPATDDNSSNGVVIAQVSSASFSGPLPPPAILQEYNEVLEGAAERIFKMAETQASHRQELEKRVVKSDILKSYLGLTAGFVVAATAIVSGSLVAYYGQPWAGAAIGGAPVAALVWAFLKGTNDRRAERDTKTTLLQQPRKS
jgi:uncharacterized membrane protein